MNNPDRRRLLVLRHANHSTDDLEKYLFDHGYSTISLSYYSQRARALKSQLPLPKNSALYPVVGVVQGVDEMLGWSEAMPVPNAAEIQRMVLLCESTHDPREPKPAPVAAVQAPAEQPRGNFVPRHDLSTTTVFEGC